MRRSASQREEVGCVLLLAFGESETPIEQRGLRRIGPKADDPEGPARLLEEMPDERGADALVTLALANVEVPQSPNAALARVGIAIETAEADELALPNHADQMFTRPIECVRSGGPIVGESSDEAQAVVCRFVFQRPQPRIQA